MRSALLSLLLMNTVYAFSQDNGRMPDTVHYPASLRLIVTSVLVNDQQKALRFYTEKLGFIKKTDIPAVKWLTVVPQDDKGSVELLLEPLKFPPAIVYQKALYDAGIPATTFGVSDIAAVADRLEKAGVQFKLKPTNVGPATIAIIDDTCGNLIQISQKNTGAGNK